MHYKYFIVPKYRLFRQGITFLLYCHGLHYFGCSYSVELIKQGHITKDLLNFLGNIAVIPVFVLTSYLSKVWTDKDKIHSRTRYLLAARLVVAAGAFFLPVTDPVLFSVVALSLQLLSNAQFFLNSMIINNFQESKFSGMYVTMMASLVNFGNNSAPHMELISRVGHWPATVAGFLLTGGVIACFPAVEHWIKAGQKEEDMQARGYVQLDGTDE